LTTHVQTTHSDSKPYVIIKTTIYNSCCLHFNSTSLSLLLFVAGLRSLR
jgi:hypothetical protein